MKKCMATLFLAFIACVPCGCAQKEKNVDVEEIKEALVSGIQLESPQVTDLSGNKNEAERYGLPLGKIENGFAYVNEKTSDKADEIIVIKAKEKKNVNEIERALEAEITGLANAWEGTDKSEFEKVQKHILRSKGKYVLLAIGEENKRAEEIFNGFFR